MKLESATTIFAVALLAVIAGQTKAHHSEAAQFDPDDPISVEGAVVKVEWANPHIWYYVDVTDESGEVTTWGFSGLPPGVLQRRGVTRNTLSVGDVVRVIGNRARDGSNNASGYRVTFADGRSVFTGSSELTAPQP